MLCGAVNSTTPEDLATATANGPASTSDAALTASVSAAIDLTKCAPPKCLVLKKIFLLFASPCPHKEPPMCMWHVACGSKLSTGN